VETGKQTFKATDDGRPQFSADGKRLHVSGRSGVASWSLPSGKRIGEAKAPSGDEWVGEREHVRDATLSPDGKFIAWRLWRAPDYSNLPQGVRPPPAVPRPIILIVT